jgi:hypothetical protein
VLAQSLVGPTPGIASRVPRNMRLQLAGAIVLMEAVGSWPGGYRTAFHCQLR